VAVRLEGLIAEASLSSRGLLRRVTGDQSVEVHAVTMDSRAVEAGALFACVKGATSDGHDFASIAVAGGAVALLCDRELPLAVPQVIVTSVRPALGPVADAFFGHPSRSLKVAGVTGTNGKTTTCAFLDSIFTENGWRSATIGTLTQQRTTPEAPELQSLLADWRDGGGRAVAMEVSSHALAQHRADAVAFAAAVFTNLTPEHLDYHVTMESYFAAKATLFHPDRTALAVINRDDQWGRRLAEMTVGRGVAVATFGLAEAEDLELDPAGSRFRWKGEEVALRLGGRFNVLNALAAGTCAGRLGVPAAVIARGLAAMTAVRGRFEPVDAGQPFTVLVDYAHTPDGLVQVLEAARELTSGRLLVVFGAGGDRDHEKRPLMGAAAARLADLAVVTSDNPRSEDPDRIIAEVVSGVEDRGNLVVEADRATAIAAALATAEPGDVVVIAGKGHERVQQVMGRVLPFDDAEVARAALDRILASRREPG
jgi:UDP-N-acetylmuramoyl-L-alanyl-D-glutamate--2,6-diaminopimelate ligase